MVKYYRTHNTGFLYFLICAHMRCNFLLDKITLLIYQILGYKLWWQKLSNMHGIYDTHINLQIYGKRHSNNLRNSWLFDKMRIYDVYSWIIECGIFIFWFCIILRINRKSSLHYKNSLIYVLYKIFFVSCFMWVVQQDPICNNVDSVHCKNVFCALCKY